MLSLALWFLVGCGIAVFLFYIGGVLWDIISMSFDLLFEGMGQLILWSVIIIGIVVLFII